MGRSAGVRTGGTVGWNKNGWDRVLELGRVGLSAEARARISWSCSIVGTKHEIVSLTNH